MGSRGQQGRIGGIGGDRQVGRDEEGRSMTSSPDDNVTALSWPNNYNNQIQRASRTPQFNPKLHILSSVETKITY